MILYKDEIKIILEDFLEKVRNKEYKKMPYDYWKCLKNSINCEIYLVKGKISLRIKDILFTDLILSYDDGSFGEYLYDKFFKKQKIDTSTCFYVPDATVEITTKTDNSNININDKINENIDKNFEERKEPNKNMKNFNFDFGPCSGENIKMSIYGLAVKNKAGTWVSYNSTTNQIVDVDIMNFDGAKYMYKIPVALNAVHVGDIIIHNRYPMFVTEVNPSTNILGAIDVCEGEVKKIIPTTNMFGFNFITKVVSLFDISNINPSPENPFGSNILPYLMLANKNDSDTSDTSDSIDFRDMLIFSNFMNGSSNSYIFNNPAMMYFLMSDKNGNDMLPLMFMMNQENFNFGNHNSETHVMTSYKNYGNSYKMEDDDVEK